MEQRDLAAVLLVLGVGTSNVDCIQTQETDSSEYASPVLPQIREPVMSPNLLSSQSEWYRFLTPKGEQEGVRDARRLASNLIFEEAWVYQRDNELWAELGKYEIPHNGNFAAAAIENAEVLDSIRDSRDIVVYHIHLESIIPSGGDMIQAVHTLRLLEKEWSEGIIDFRVVSPNHICGYGLTEQGYDLFVVQGEDPTSAAQSWQENLDEAGRDAYGDGYDGRGRELNTETDFFTASVRHLDDFLSE